MATEIETLFYEELPQAFDENLDAARERLEALQDSDDPAAQAKAERLEDRLDDLEDLETTLRVELQGDGGGDFYLNFADASLEVADEPESEPIVWVTQSVTDFLAMRNEGAGALSALGGAEKAKGRIIDPGIAERVAGLDVTLAIVLSQGDTFSEASALVRLGRGNQKSAPQITIRASIPDLKDIVAARMPAPQAFMAGKIRIEGDMALAMKLISVVMK